MDIQQLRYFVLVAKHLNFTAASKEIHIDQSALSKQIADFESHLGLKLFLRSTRSVQLTAAGAELLKDATELITKSEEVIMRAHLAAKGSIGSLRIGFTGAIENEKDKFPAFIKKFRTAYPDVNLSLLRFNLGPLNQALERSDVDIAFTFSQGLEEIPGITWDKYPLYPQSMPMCVVVSADHPLANAQKVELSTLANEPFVTFSRTDAPTNYDDTLRLCASHGLHPNIVCEAPLLENLLLLIETGIGIAILSRHTQAVAGGNIRFIEIEDCDYLIDRVVAWRKTNSNPLIKLFLTSLQA